MTKLEYEILLAYVLGVSRAWLHTYPEKCARLEPPLQKKLAGLVRRRAQGEPLAYLTGTQEFWSLPLRVNRHTLIPRPESELLVELTLTLAPHDVAWSVADLGTGCGAIAVALAHARPGWRVVATDRDPRALAVARRNAKQTSIRCYPGDWCAALPAERKFHAMVSNPPYIAAKDPHLRGEIRYEPPSALVGGVDGLAELRRIVPQARAHLMAQGWLLLEHGYDQAMAVRTLFTEAGYRDVKTYPDLAGHGRVTVGRWEM